MVGNNFTPQFIIYNIIIYKDTVPITLVIISVVHYQGGDSSEHKRQHDRHDFHVSCLEDFYGYEGSEKDYAADEAA